ncbi:MAG: LysR family transcriptional regulator [Gammaproteobacteria bacterium]|nr:transcriptional regulator [Gammaproteobacteria bacterium]
MELRHLRYFLAVAEERNFTRAAKRLHIAQPPLTQQIKALERELGVTLFDRSGYRVELTEAGRLFATEVSRILGDIRRAVLLAQRAARGMTGEVRVGFTESASFNPLVMGTFQSFRSAYPEVELALEERKSTDLSIALSEGCIDAAFVRPPLSAGDGLTLHLLESEEMVVAVPANHPLAAQTQVELRALENETFILYPRAVRPGLADAVMEACQAAGFTPRVGQHAPQLSSTINLVAASLGISVVPRSMIGLQPQAVRYLALQGAPIRADLGIAHRTGESAVAVLNFIETAKSIAAAARTSRGDT